MSRARRIAVLAAFALAGATAAAAAGADDAPAPRRRLGTKRAGDSALSPAAPGTTKPAASADATHCAACHVAGGWQQVRFNHDRTGFPLRGGHTAVTCSGCHARGFDVPIADSCAGCHRDRHAGEFGTQCEGCHEDRSWRPLFNADAHRRTAFPLVGKHGLIPCEQCHGNMRDRAFVGAPVACASCHQADYDRTRMSGVDHVAAGFSRACQTCHSTWRFWPARVVAHEPCFYLASGPHHGIRCLGCHTSLPTIMFTSMCTSGVGTATCTSCHEHNCAKSDAQHANIDPVLRASYQCTDGSCLTCHQKGTL